MAMKKDSLFNQFGTDSPHLKVNIFNNYRIIGLLEEISFVTTKGCFYSLQFNHTNNQFILLKKFNTGKMHIDFFKNEDGFSGSLHHFDNDNLLINFLSDYLIAKSVGYDVKTLHYYQDKKKYVVKWTANNMDYSMEF
jgi:hypothetical protein